ncbi:hypothetical protein [Nonomuraea typhae]|uniref:Uncharacterized protein n=1 Tax=Nonomuraea typhae TaxID=2603600 RepID=A0ABW7YM87_9ACTN
MPEPLTLPVPLVDLTRIVAEEFAGHEHHVRCVALLDAAQALRARAQAIVDSRGEVDEPLAEAIWKGCGRHPGAPFTVDDPRTIARLALLAIADDLACMARIDPEHLGTEERDGD